MDSLVEGTFYDAQTAEAAALYALEKAGRHLNDYGAE